MAAETLAAAISAITSVIVVLTTQYFGERSKQQTEQIQKQTTAAQKRDQLNCSYLNPLRFSLEECYARLQRIRHRMAEEDGFCAWLIRIDKPDELLTKDGTWFTYDGYFLISSCYITACLFYYIHKARLDIPYLQLDVKDDVVLLELLTEISLAFAKQSGIPYVLQGSIGSDIFIVESERLLSYREFCEKLQDPKQRQWFDRLIGFYIEIGHNQRTEKMNQAIQSIQKLLRFLETVVPGGTPIEQRMEEQWRDQITK